MIFGFFLFLFSLVPTGCASERNLSDFYLVYCPRFWRRLSRGQIMRDGLGEQHGLCISHRRAQCTICPSCWDRDESYISPRCGQEKHGYEWLGEKPVGDVMHRRRGGKFTWTGDVPAGLRSRSRPYRMRNANARRSESGQRSVWWMIAGMIILSRFSLFLHFCPVGSGPAFDSCFPPGSLFCQWLVALGMSSGTAIILDTAPC